MHVSSRARKAPAGMRLKKATQLLISGETRAGICGYAPSGGWALSTAASAIPTPSAPSSRAFALTISAVSATRLSWHSLRSPPHLGETAEEHHGGTNGRAEGRSPRRDRGREVRTGRALPADPRRRRRDHADPDGHPDFSTRLRGARALASLHGGPAHPGRCGRGVGGRPRGREGDAPQGRHDRDPAPGAAQLPRGGRRGAPPPRHSRLAQADRQLQGRRAERRARLPGFRDLTAGPAIGRGQTRSTSRRPKSPHGRTNKVAITTRDDPTWLNPPP